MRAMNYVVRLFHSFGHKNKWGISRAETVKTVIVTVQ